MIEGLQIQLTTAELGDMIDAALAYHVKREAFYAQQTEALRKERDGRSSGDPFWALEARTKESRQQVRRLTMIRAHLIPDETYRLRDHDAVALLVPEDDD